MCWKWKQKILLKLVLSSVDVFDLSKAEKLNDYKVKTIYACTYIWDTKSAIIVIRIYNFLFIRFIHLLYMDVYIHLQWDGKIFIIIYIGDIELERSGFYSLMDQIVIFLCCRALVTLLLHLLTCLFCFLAGWF